MGFDWETCAVLVAIDKQSPDIAMGVNEGDNKEQGAGDQGLMFGYASNETTVLMPAPITYAHRLVRRQSRSTAQGRAALVAPGRQEPGHVPLRWTGAGRHRGGGAVHPARPRSQPGSIREAVMEEIIKPVLPAQWVDDKTNYFINPTGRFVIGGPVGDCGLTGRKIIVDTYGGMARHGGGAFSGKDPSKVDRSAAYAARYVAKNIVAGGLADRCEVQVSYAIGVAEPTSIRVDTFGTGNISEHRIVELVQRTIRPASPRHGANAGLVAPDLPQHGGIRTLRPRRPGFALGAHRQGGRLARRRRPIMNDRSDPGSKSAFRSRLAAMPHNAAHPCDASL